MTVVLLEIMGWQLLLCQCSLKCLKNENTLMVSFYSLISLLIWCHQRINPIVSVFWIYQSWCKDLIIFRIQRGLLQESSKLWKICVIYVVKKMSTYNNKYGTNIFSYAGMLPVLCQILQRKLTCMFMFWSHVDVTFAIGVPRTLTICHKLSWFVLNTVVNFTRITIDNFCLVGKLMTARGDQSLMFQ